MLAGKLEDDMFGVTYQAGKAYDFSLCKLMASLAVWWRYLG